jgi:shikimate dehydrogenase
VGAPPKPARLLVNVTPIGMAGGPQEHDLSFARELVEQAEVVFEVVAFPAQTPLVRLGGGLGLTMLTGAEVIAVQAAEQFVLYTGVRPSPDQVRRASEFSRG